MKKGFILFLLFCTGNLFSQEVIWPEQVNNTINMILRPAVKALYAAKTDDEKETANKLVLQTVESILNMPTSFDNDFDSLKKDMASLRAPDNTFRIINWNVVKTDGTNEYYGFIQEKHMDIKRSGMFHKSKTVVMQVYQLTDKSAEIKNPENAITDNTKWFGMLYYKMIPKEVKGKMYFTMLARDMNDKLTQKKIIDVISFDNKGVPHFGADIFNYGKKYPKRIIFEYSASCTMSLKYSDKKDSIIFDRLIPTQDKLEGQYQYYCTSFEYDGFGFKKGKWNFGTDLKPYNEKEETDKIYHDPHDRTPGSDESNKIIERKKRKKKK